MVTNTLYRYLGTNGVIESPVHLEDIYYVRLKELIAEGRNQLTNGIRTAKRVVVPEDEANQWHEIPLDINN